MTMPRPHPTDEMLLLYLDGENSSQVRSDIERHCEGCAACRDRLAAMERTGRLVADTRADAPLRPVWPEIAAHITAAGRPFLTPALTVGAAAAVCAGILLGLVLGEAPVMLGGDDAGHTLATLEDTRTLEAAGAVGGTAEGDEASLWETVGSTNVTEAYDLWPVLDTPSDSDVGVGEGG